MNKAELKAEVVSWIDSEVKEGDVDLDEVSADLAEYIVDLAGDTEGEDSGA